MMKRGRGEVTGRGGRGKWGVTLAALVIVAAQLLALAHSHSSSGAPRFAPPTQTAAAVDICGLCMLVLHAPLSLGSTPALDRPRSAMAVASGAQTLSFASSSHSFFLTRAPPAVT